MDSKDVGRRRTKEKGGDREWRKDQQKQTIKDKSVIEVQWWWWISIKKQLINYGQLISWASKWSKVREKSMRNSWVVKIAKEEKMVNERWR